MGLSEEINKLYDNVNAGMDVAANRQLVQWYEEANRLDERLNAESDRRLIGNLHRQLKGSRQDFERGSEHLEKYEQRVDQYSALKKFYDPKVSAHNTLQTKINTVRIRLHGKLKKLIEQKKQENTQKKHSPGSGKKM